MDVKELVGKWSEEERKKLKPLIDECLEREEAVKKSREKGKRITKTTAMELFGLGAEMLWCTSANKNSVGRC